MKQTITESMFIDAFKAIRPDNFTYAGLRAMFEWFEEMEDGTGEEIELDVIAICCDFSEYESATACVEECGYKDCDYEEPENMEKTALEYLHENTLVIEFGGGIIIQDF